MKKVYEKVLILGDTHGRSVWKLIVHQEKPDLVIFIGDYYDTHDDIPGNLQHENLKEILKWKEDNKEICDVILLIGNHDIHYFPEVGYTGTSGFQDNLKDVFGKLLDENRNFFQMAFQYGNYLFTHAGVSEVWLKNNGWNDTQNIANFINNLWETNKQAFNFTPDKFSDWSGDSKTQPPIWIRPISLIKSSDNINLHQVMGHTTQGKLRIADVKNDGSKLYYFIDTLGTSREYLLIEKGNYCYAKRY